MSLCINTQPVLMAKNLISDLLQAEMGFQIWVIQCLLVQSFCSAHPFLNSSLSKRKAGRAYLTILNRLLFTECSWNSRTTNLINIFEKAKLPWLEKLGIPHCQPGLEYEIQAWCWMRCWMVVHINFAEHRRRETMEKALHLEKTAFQYHPRNLEEK